jgi:hypothetical protein
MGTLVGGLIILVNAVTIVRAVADVPSWVGWTGVLGRHRDDRGRCSPGWRRERAERASALERAID